jgi:hypothetical protein
MLIAALWSCGKKTQSNPESFIQPLDPTSTEIEAYMAKQALTCEGGQSCPNYIAKVVVNVGGGKYRHCTGFLIEDDVLVTSASCLPALLRLNGQDCSKDVFFFFAQPFYISQRVGCREVIQASDSNLSDPKLARDDLAFLRISSPLRFRRQLRISRDGISNGERVSIAAVEQVDEQNGFIRTMDCPAALGSWVNPLVSNESSPGVTLSGCAFKNGFSGAAILDPRNKSKALGVVSLPMDPADRNYILRSGLLSNGLQEFIHGSNFACAPTIYDTDVANEKECGKELSRTQLEKYRSAMLSTTGLFNDLKAKLSDSLETNKFIHYSIKLTPQNGNADIQDIEITPKCFKDLNLIPNDKKFYIYHFMLPQRSFKRVMDDLARVTGMEVDKGAIDFNISLFPKDMRNNGFSSVLFWDPTSGNVVRSFYNVPTACPASLL